MGRIPVIPSLYSADLPALVDFYINTLGFTQTGLFAEGDEITWTELSLGEATLWFFARPISDRPDPAMSGLIFVFVDDVDEIADRLRGKVPFRWGPETQEYQIRELAIEDPDGYLLVFAKDV